MRDGLVNAGPGRAAEEAAAEQAAAQRQSEQQAAVSCASCSGVQAAGAAPIDRGGPGCSSRLDRDGDGDGVAWQT